MTEIKTKPTEADVTAYLAARASEPQMADCKRLMAIFEKLTGEQPKMWGPSIVGYGKYRYSTAGGRTGDMPVAAFAIRGPQLVVYLDCEGPEQAELLSRVGKHKLGKSCFYFKRLDDLELPVFERILELSILRK